MEPVSMRESLIKAVDLMQGGNFQDARVHFRKALDASPDNFDVLHLFGVLEHKLGQYESARDLMQKALLINPNFSDAHYNLAKVLEEQGHLDEAIQSYRKAIQIDPSLDAGFFNMALIYEKQKNILKAIDCYIEAIRINPNDCDYFFNLGNAYKSQSQAHLAVENYEAALKIDPSQFRVLNNLGIVLKDKGDLDRAVKAFQKAIETHPDYADAFYNLGNAYEEAGQHKMALATYKNAISCDPQMAKAYNNLGNIHYVLKEFAEAQIAYQETIKIDPDSQSAVHMLNALKGTKAHSAPPQYVESLFDKAAADFEDRLVDDLKYRSPDELKKLILVDVDETLNFDNALDLGCGTGLSGAAFRPLAKKMVGVDISGKMVAIARKKAIYDDLHVKEILGFLDQSDDTYDLFLAADVLAYFGDLSDIFAGVKNRASDNAYFLFTLEGVESEDYLLRKTGRFSHSIEYIEVLAKENGLEIIACQDTIIRKENDKPIQGMNMILRFT